MKQRSPADVRMIVGGVFALCAGVVMLWCGAGGSIQELRLRSGHETTEADVLATRIMRSRRTGSLSYEVQYQFKIPDSGKVYTRSDETGRSELWSSVSSESEYREAQTSGKVTVIYLASNPHVSRPLQAGCMPLGDKITGIIVGIFLLVAGIVALRDEIPWPRRLNDKT